VILSAKRVWPNMITKILYVQSLPTPWASAGGGSKTGVCLHGNFD